MDGEIMQEGFMVFCPDKSIVMSTVAYRSSVLAARFPDGGRVI
jgi:hypothetical protein